MELAETDSQLKCRMLIAVNGGDAPSRAHSGYIGPLLDSGLKNERKDVWLVGARGASWRTFRHSTIEGRRPLAPEAMEYGRYVRRILTFEVQRRRIADMGAISRRSVQHRLVPPQPRSM